MGLLKEVKGHVCESRQSSSLNCEKHTQGGAESRAIAAEDKKKIDNRLRAQGKKKEDRRDDDKAWNVKRAMKSFSELWLFQCHCLVFTSALHWSVVKLLSPHRRMRNYDSRLGVAFFFRAFTFRMHISSQFDLN